MDVRGLALSGSGVVLLYITVRMSGLSTGYGIGPPSVLLRVGVGYAVLGILGEGFVAGYLLDSK